MSVPVVVVGSASGLAALQVGSGEAAEAEDQLASPEAEDQLYLQSRKRMHASFSRFLPYKGEAIKERRPLVEVEKDGEDRAAYKVSLK